MFDFCKELKISERENYFTNQLLFKNEPNIEFLFWKPNILIAKK